MPKPQRTEGTAMRQVLSALKHHGLLLKQDKVLPSVVGIVTGQALDSSWWSHVRAHEIFALLEALAERTDLLETKLLRGKVTFVAQSLWPALLGVSSSEEPWQGAGLSPAAQHLLAEVTRSAEVQASGPAVKELEQRLLVRTTQRHTPSGRHVLVLESWPRWAAHHSVTALPLAQARAALEAATLSLGAPLEALPWLRKTSGKAAKRRAVP